MPSLSTYRRYKGLTQRTLAKMAGVTSQTIYSIEAGRTRPSLKAMRLICTSLEVDPNQIDEFRATLELDRST